MQFQTSNKDMTFFNNLKCLCAEKGMSVTALGQELGFSNATTSGWRRGAQPRGKTMKMIADYFNISIDRLMNSCFIISDNNCVIGSHDSNITVKDSTNVLSEQEEELLKTFRQLKVLDRARLLVYAEELKTNQK